MKNLESKLSKVAENTSKNELVIKGFYKQKKNEP